MKVFEGVRSLFGSRQAEAEMGLGARLPLTKPIIESIRKHSVQLRASDLSQYKFERRRSTYPGARADLVIYDPEGKPVLDGRESSAGYSFWPHKMA